MGRGLGLGDGGVGGEVGVHDRVNAEPRRHPVDVVEVSALGVDVDYVQVVEARGPQSLDIVLVIEPGERVSFTA